MSEPSDEQLAEWLELAECSGFWALDQCALVARTNWPATIRALQNARARIADLEAALKEACNG